MHLINGFQQTPQVNQRFAALLRGGELNGLDAEMGGSSKVDIQVINEDRLLRVELVMFEQVAENGRFRLDQTHPRGDDLAVNKLKKGIGLFQVLHGHFAHVGEGIKAVTGCF